MLIFPVQRHTDPETFPSRFGAADGEPWTTDTPRTRECKEVAPALWPYARQARRRDMCGAMPGALDVGELADHPAIFRRDRLQRERRAYEDQKRCLAGRPSLDQGPRRQDLDQC